MAKEEKSEKNQEKKESKEGLTVKREEDFSEWYTQVLEKAEVTDIRYGVKGFVVIRPWGAMAIENMFRMFEEALRKRGHWPSFFPIAIPGKNFEKEAEHVEGFTPEVFWLEQVKGEEKLALRPTSETGFYQMYNLWIRSWRDLPLKIYQRANVFRYETKATRPLIRAREFYWIEAHDAFSSKEEAEDQVQKDIQTTEEVMHQKLGIPFYPMKRPSWDTFPGAMYTVGSDVLMPNGKLIQQPSTHLLGQHFAKAFDVSFRNQDGKYDYAWQTCYGPAMSRILASVVSLHGDNQGLVMPFCLAPLQTVIVPICKKNNQEKVLNEAEKIKEKLLEQGLRVEVDNSDKTPGEKFNKWELKGVPFRIELGEKEIDSGEATVSTRDNGEKQKLNISEMEKIKSLGEEFDKRLKENADEFTKNKTVECSSKEEVEKALEEGKIAKVNFCSASKEGEKCAEVVEKELNAEVRGTRPDIDEKPEEEKCIFCGEEANEVVYIGRSY